MKRIRYILLCLLPLLASICLQNLAAIPLFGISAILLLLQGGSGLSLTQLFDQCSRIWTSSGFTTWISLIYAVASLFVFVFWYRKKNCRRTGASPIPACI